MITLLVFEIFNLLDFIFSYNTIIVGGVAEANPIILGIMNVLTPLQGLVIVKVFAAVCGVFLYWVKAKRALLFVTVPYGLLVVYHVFLVS
jgi:hypothetical protein